MSNPVVLACLLAAETVFMWYAARRPDMMIRIFIVTQMILIALFGPKLFELFGYVTNVAGVFHASAFVAIAALFKLYGSKETLGAIERVLFGLAVVYTLSWLLAVVVPAPQNYGTSLAIDGVVRYQPPVIFASLLAAVISIYAFILSAERMPQWWGAAAALVIAQTIDSLIFYPIAFGNFPVSVMLTIAVTGWLFKLACSVALAPAYLLAVGKRGTVAPVRSQKDVTK